MTDTRNVTVKGGPLHGKTVTVAENATAFTHHADESSFYKVNEKTATWQADTKAKLEDIEQPTVEPGVVTQD